MDWEQLLAATFDPADAMFLGPDEMFSLNRNDVLYAQKYAAARTSAAAPPTPPAAERALNDEDLERCANDLDRFVNDLELACANIGQRDDGTDTRPELTTSNARGHDLDPDIDADQGRADNLDQNQRKSSPTGDRVDLFNGQGRVVDLDLDEGHGVSQPLNNSADDLEDVDLSSVDDLSTENRLQDSDDNLDKREDSAEQDDCERRVLSDLDPGDLEVANGPEIALCEMRDDHAAVHHRYPYDPDPEATVV